MPKPTHLFVYGSLRRSANHPMAKLLQANARAVGAGSIAGKLYDLGPYSAAAASDDGSRVKGELFALANPRRTLAALDRYEGCGPDDPQPHPYAREEVEVLLEGGRTLRAFAYIYRGDLSRARIVHGGDYFAHMSRRRTSRP